VLKILMSIGTRKMRYRLVSPNEAGDNSEIELGIPRGAAGSSSNKLTVRCWPIVGDLCEAPPLTSVKFSELGAADISPKPKPPGTRPISRDARETVRPARRLRKAGSRGSEDMTKRKEKIV
jgi:hypothetical protein